MLELCADRVWLVRGGGCQPFDGDVADYRRLLQEERRSERREAREDKAARKEERRNGDGRRSGLAAEKRAVRDTEARIQRLVKERDTIRGRLADPTVYEGPGAHIAGLQIKLAEVETALAQAENAWLAAQEVLEAAGS